MARDKNDYVSIRVDFYLFSLSLFVNNELTSFSSDRTPLSTETYLSRLIQSVPFSFIPDREDTAARSAIKSVRETDM